MNLKKDNIKKIFVSVIVTIVGAIIMAFGVSMFLLPSQLSSGGVSGIATILYYLFHIPMGTTIFLVNIPLFIFAFLKLGKQTFFYSIIGTVSLSLFVDLFENLRPLTEDRLLASIYGGILVGLGTGIVLKVNSSTGGTELFSQPLKKYNHSIQSGTAIAITDIIVVGLNVIFLKEIEIALYSAIAIYLCGKIVDIIFEGVYFTKLFFIVSNKNEDIAKEIGEQIQRGATGIYGKGMYSDENKLVLMCAASRRDVAKIRNLATKIDPKCFMIITNSREVLGEGFKGE